MDNSLKEEEVLIDIESGGERGVPSGGKHKHKHKQGKITLEKLASGILSFNGADEFENSDVVSGGSPQETTKLLVGGQQSVENDRRKAGKAKRAQKPPRPPKGPTLDAADMRLVKEISKITKKKQERMERLKAIKKMKAAKVLSPSSSSSTSSSSGATISAMFITIFFFLVLLFQGLSSSSSPKFKLSGAPQLAPDTAGLIRVEFYKGVMSDDGLPPKSAG